MSRTEDFKADLQALVEEYSDIATLKKNITLNVDDEEKFGTLAWTAEGSPVHFDFAINLNKEKTKESSQSDVDAEFDDFVERALKRGTIYSKNGKYKYSNIFDIEASKNGYVYIIYKGISDRKRDFLGLSKEALLENWYIPEY